jgi:3-oxoacyl-(acyl-carrier-protein) synthase
MHFPNSVANAPASQVGILEGLQGANLTFFEKQGGGLRALLEARQLVATGRVEAMLAGGVDEAQWLNAECFSRLQALAAPSRPGFTLGEGAALGLVAADGPVVLAGAGAASEPCPPHLYPTQGQAILRACQKALAQAGLSPRDVDLVVSLANGSPPLEALEKQVLLTLFAQHRPAVLGEVSQRLGEGAFSSALRLVVAALVLAERLPVAWPAPRHLAQEGFASLAEASAPAKTALVTALAGGGSALAVVLATP